jgi:hypothetical protein
MYDSILAAFIALITWFLGFLGTIFSWVINIFGVIVFTVIGAIYPSFSPDAFTQALTNISPGAWYFWDYLNLDFAIQSIFTALLARFIIRFIPVVGN